MARTQEWWDRFFLGMADYISQASKDPSTKVGAILTDTKRRVISVGYNGQAQGIADTEERLHNRELKYLTTIHGEVNCIIFSQRDLSGCTLFTTPFLPCSVCASIVIQSGICRVVSYVNDNPRWIKSFDLSQSLFEEARVELKLYDQ